MDQKHCRDRLARMAAAGARGARGARGAHAGQLSRWEGKGAIAYPGHIATVDMP